MKTVLTVAGAATLAFAGYILVFKKLSILRIKSMRWTPSRLLAKVRVLASDAHSRWLHAPGEKARNLDEGYYFADTTFACVSGFSAGSASVLGTESSFGP